MNKPLDAAAFPPATNPDEDVELTRHGRLALYLAVALAAGSVIALQIDIMRVFAVGNWTHFGSLVVSLAMLGFGLVSAVMASAKSWFQRHWQGAATFGLGLMGPLAVAANLYVQSLKFNPIYLVSDPDAEVEAAGDLPGLADAVPRRRAVSGLRVPEEQQDVRPRLFRRSRRLRAFGAGVPRRDVSVATRSTSSRRRWRCGWRPAWPGPSCPAARWARIPFALAAIVAFAGHFLVAPALGLPRLAVNDYKGASYARRLPEAKQVYESASPFGFLQAYTTSYLHFAPGLSDNAALQPADRCRPTPTWASTSTATARSASCAI